MKNLILLFTLPLLVLECLAQPANDDCANAQLLAVGQTCSLQSFDSEDCTAENPQPAPGPGCGFFQGTDVWFKAVMPNSGALRIERDNGTLNAQFAIYSGTCGNMEVVSCAQLDDERTIHRVELAGQEVYIRVWGYNTTNGGTFELCAWEPQIPVNDVCANATALTVSQSCSLQQYSGLYATTDTIGTAPGPGCGFYQGGDVWFSFEMPLSGEFRIERNNLSGNAQFAVYSGTCGNMEVVSCAQLDGERTIVEPGLAGETLYLRLFGYNTEEGAEFELCLWDPPVPENDLCANAMEIPVGDSCVFSEYSGLYATTDSAGTAQNPGCGFYQGGDVWFTLEVPPSGKVRLDRNNFSGNAQFALYEGTCGDFTSVIDCAQLTSEMEIDEPTLAGETVYLRVFGYNTEEGAEFELCAWDTSCVSFEVTAQQIGNELWAFPADLGPYLWLGCNGTPYPAHTSQAYLPTSSGEYRVVAANNIGCLDTSECISVTITDIEESQDAKIQIYPNPSTGLFEVNWAENEKINVQVFDFQGKAVLEESRNTNRFTIDLSDFVYGLYTLRISSPSAIQHRTLILQH